MSVRLDDSDARPLLEALDAYDTEIEALQASKRELFADARAQLEGLGASKSDIKVCIAAIKKAVVDLRRKRMKPEAAEEADERDALAEHYVTLVSRAAHGAHAHTREAA